jgi:regulator of sigma E protease
MEYAGYGMALISLSFLKGTLGFIFVIGILIVIHEWGHYYAAKRAGVPVEQFSIGFGPSLWKFAQREETEFHLRLLPLGGYVRITGMEPDDMVPNGYNAQSTFTRSKIISAGALVNLVFGFLLIVLIGMTFGIPRDRAAVADVQPNTPAYAGGLRNGDIFVSVNGKMIEQASDLTDAIQNSANVALPMTVLRGEEIIALTPTPKEITVGGKKMGRLEVTIGSNPEFRRYGFVASIREGAKESANFAWGLLSNLVRKDSWANKEFGGPVAIAQVAGRQANMGLKYYLFFLAAFSINLGILNLLPLPILDGGHLVLLGVEAVRRKRPSKTAVMAYQSVGLVLLLGFFLVITYWDFARLFGKG